MKILPIIVSHMFYVFSDFSVIFLNYFRFEDHIIFPEFQDLGFYQNRIIENMRKYAPDIKIHFSPCDDIAFYGGCFNCISNFKYR